ncbi:MAG TPA: membrane dipeptidase, partial [Chitinophagaceae bacterium]|nr:membrane dipeptidase [Chitinophagaceae bacterium]
MEVAYTPADLYRIIKSNKLAVIPGIEVDYMGNFPLTMPDNADSRAKVDRELDRLYSNGVRYIFPIHLSDNAFGGTAIYEDMMNVMQKVGTNTFWKMECAAPRDSINHKYSALLDSRIRDGLRAGLPIAPAIFEAINQLLPLPPGIKEMVTPILSGIIASAGVAGNTAGQAALSVMPDNPPDCGTGHRNSRTLTDIGRYAIKRMMQKGMMVDIDHMSEYGVHETLKMAMQYNYPVNSGHTGVRDPSASENQRTYRMLDTLTTLGGMFGIGWSGQQAGDWVLNYRKGLKGMRYRGVCFGSDANSVVYTPKPRPGSNVRYFDGFAAPASYGHTWNYNSDGMAHYGMVRDFIRDIRNMGNVRELNVLFSSAQEFYLMWQKCDMSKRYIH